MRRFCRILAMFCPRCYSLQTCVVRIQVAWRTCFRTLARERYLENTFKKRIYVRAKKAVLRLINWLLFILSFRSILSKYDRKWHPENTHVRARVASHSPASRKSTQIHTHSRLVCVLRFGHRRKDILLLCCISPCPNRGQLIVGEKVELAFSLLVAIRW